MLLRVGENAPVRLGRVSTELTEIAPGVVRLLWSGELQAAGVTAAADEVRRVVAAGFADGHRRI